MKGKNLPLLILTQRYLLVKQAGKKSTEPRWTFWQGNSPDRSGAGWLRNQVPIDHLGKTLVGPVFLHGFLASRLSEFVLPKKNAGYLCHTLVQGRSRRESISATLF